MTAIPQNVRAVRIGFAATLLVACVLCLIQWMGHLNGAESILVGLAGFAMLGVALCVVPFSRGSLREALLVLGAVITTISVGLFGSLFLLLRNL